MQGISIHLARPEDAETIAELIRELAAYEKLEGEAHPSVEALRNQLDPRGGEIRVRCLVAKVGGEVAGFALYYPRYSTFETNWGMHLEDLYVREAYRSKGVGLELIKVLAAIATKHGCRRLDLNVLHWNERAIAFYQRHGGAVNADWKQVRFNPDTLRALAFGAVMYV